MPSISYPNLKLGCALVCAFAAGLAVKADDSLNEVEHLPVFRVAESRSLGDHYRLPHVTESITAARVSETINVVDAEDAVKYLPSIFVRKRNPGDTQPVMGTRVWGVSSSARSLVYADGVLLSALIANNNSIGAPRWGLVAPTEIERVDLAHGPFAAAFPGNSMGAVLQITTRMPERFEGSLSQTMAWQNFSLYGTRNTYRMSQTAASVGDRVGNLSFWVSANHQDSASQPLSFVTSTASPAGTSGGFATHNKLGQPITITGASGLLTTGMTNAKIKAACDFSSTVRATYTLGLWRNDAESAAETYLRNENGNPTFAGLVGFASGTYDLSQAHSMQSASVKLNPRTGWELELTASLYRMDRDRQRFPVTAARDGTRFGTAGRTADMAGTNWSTLDAKMHWRSGAGTGSHRASFGAHDEGYELRNSTVNTADWRADSPSTSLATAGNGKTRTHALWAEDIWQLAPSVKLTLGARYEKWRAYDGDNFAGGVAVQQPEVRATKFSPKAALAWDVTPVWSVTASFGQAYRFATAAELYQLVSTGTTFTSPNPNLKPDDVTAAELRIERSLANGFARLSVFQDDVRDAIVSQYNPLVPGSPTLFQFVSNVDRVRARGAELSFQRNHAFVRGLEFSGSVTYVDARTLATDGRGQFGSAIGKRLPNIPDWRATLVATWRPDERWAVTLAGRYSGMMFSTLDNADVNPNAYQGFAAWFVTDMRVHCRINRHWSASLGADNLLNRSYFLFHPFPQRTVVAELKYAF